MSAQAEMVIRKPTTLLDITNYWQPYGLNQDPFTTSNDGIYYSLPRWEEHLDLLQYLCHYNNVMIVLTGVNGSGKTTLMKQFTAQSAETFSLCEITADSAFNLQRLITVMGQAFSLPVNSEDSLEDQIDLQLSKIQSHSKICVMTIDDAHLLSVEILRTLLYLIGQQSNSQMRLHIILLGEPQLQMSLMRLVQIEGNAELIHSIILEPFMLEETEHYLEYRLQASGLQEEVPLTQLEVARIYKLSEGIPGRINRVARRTLLNLLAKQQLEALPSSVTTYKTKLLGGLLLMLLLGSVMLVLNKLDSPRPIRSVGSRTVAINNEIVSPAAANTYQHSAPIQQVFYPVAPPVVQKVNDVKPTFINSQTKLVEQKNSISTNLSAVVPTAPSTSSPSSGSNANKVDPSLSSVNDKPIVATAFPDKVAKVAAVTSYKKQVPLNSSANGYTLQLLGLSSEQSARAFIGRQQLQGKAFYYHMALKEGKELYVIVYGEYKTSSEAQSAIKKLPVALQDLKPWPKKLSVLRAETRK